MTPASADRTRRFRIARVGAFALTAAIAATLFAAMPSARAADATGCSGRAESYGPEGGLLDEMSAPGPGGTTADPFDIFADGSIRYSGMTEQVMRNGSWSVDVGGFLGFLSTVSEAVAGRSLLGGTIGPGGDSSREGEFAANDYIGKLRLSGLHHVTVSLNGEGGASCVATAWIRLHQPFWQSIIAVGGLAFLFIAILLMYFGAPAWAVENLTFELYESQLSPPVQDEGHP